MSRRPPPPSLRSGSSISATSPGRTRRNADASASCVSTRRARRCASWRPRVDELVGEVFVAGDVVRVQERGQRVDVLVRERDRVLHRARAVPGDEPGVPQRVPDALGEVAHGRAARDPSRRAARARRRRIRGRARGGRRSRGRRARRASCRRRPRTIRAASGRARPPALRRTRRRARVVSASNDAAGVPQRCRDHCVTVATRYESRRGNVRHQARARRPPGPLAADQGAQVLDRLRRGEEVSLRFVAPERNELGELALGLDPFGHDLQVERVREPDHGGHDRGVARVGAEPAHERAIDLDRIHREALQVAERRVAGAEVVDRRTARRGPGPVRRR